ncbi:hypothetical protein [Frondihabitans sp. PAMC 28766]|uniref:hypothetical protein n=1 Tax=Frondihabitans sp. PAMC 28766 TaxID=1795630 RepID=UPI001950D3C5|nr:hypothetical protein [Frondihabitans sp. PAMC 28766]
MTTQQTALALGVASLGSVFTSVATHSMLDAATVAGVVMVVILAVLVTLSIRLPAVRKL